MDNNLDNEILKALFQFSTPEISDALDALGIQGLLNSIKPIASSTKLMGPAYTIQYEPVTQKPEQFMQASNYIDEVPPGSVIIIDNGGNTSCSVWGKILTHYAKNKKIAGTVVHGAIRDVQAQKQYDYPIFACGITARTGKNRAKIKSQRETLEIEGVKIKFNDIIFADVNGTIVIPKEMVGKIVAMVQNIATNEGKIINAIDAGKSLKEAREIYHYDKPWEKDN